MIDATRRGFLGGAAALFALAAVSPAIAEAAEIVRQAPEPNAILQNARIAFKTAAGNFITGAHDHSIGADRYLSVGASGFSFTLHRDIVETTIEPSYGFREFEPGRRSLEFELFLINTDRFYDFSRALQNGCMFEREVETSMVIGEDTVTFGKCYVQRFEYEINRDTQSRARFELALPWQAPERLA